MTIYAIIFDYVTIKFEHLTMSPTVATLTSRNAHDEVYVVASVCSYYILFE